MKPQRVFGAYTFQRLALIRPETEGHGQILQYSPHARFANRRNLPLHAYGSGPFCRFSIPGLPTSAGVYVITAASVFKYIGECADLAERFGSRGYGLISPRNCFVGGQSTNCRINHLILTQARDGALLELWFTSVSSRKSIERELLSGLNPPWNI